MFSFSKMDLSDQSLAAALDEIHFRQGGELTLNSYIDVELDEVS